jgi:hypothetical protein
LTQQYYIIGLLEMSAQNPFKDPNPHAELIQTYRLLDVQEQGLKVDIDSHKTAVENAEKALNAVREQKRVIAQKVLIA